jgi:hypothetical protein
MGKVLPGKFAEKTTDSICEALVKVRILSNSKRIHERYNF